MPKQTTALEAVKIQARAVIPIVRALERELGKGRAHALVGQAIAESYAEWQTKAVTARNSHPRNTDIEAQLPIETDVVEDSDTTYAVVGAPLTCGVDFAAEAALRPDWDFRRTQTIMGGASHCDFRWRLRTAAEGEEAKPQNDGG